MHGVRKYLQLFKRLMYVHKFGFFSTITRNFNFQKEKMKKIISLTIILTVFLCVKASAQTSDVGTFVANTLTAVSLFDHGSLLLNQVRKDKEANISVEGFTNSLKFKNDNPIDPVFSGKDTGLLAGLDMFKTDNFVVGMLARYSVTELEQTQDYSKITDIGFGGYLGFFSNGIDIKALIRAGYQTYSSKKTDSMVRTQDDFSGKSVVANVEIKRKIFGSGVFQLNPFINYNAALSITNGMELDGLSVAENKYFASNAGGGLAMELHLSGFFISVSAGADYILTGDVNTIDASISGVDTQIVSTKQDNLIKKANASLEFNISQNIGMFFNAGYQVSATYENIFGGVGINYQFGE